MSRFCPSPFALADAPELYTEERALVIALSGLIQEVRMRGAPAPSELFAEAIGAAQWRWLTQGAASVRPSATLSGAAMRRVLMRAAVDCPAAADLIVCLLLALTEARGVRDSVLERFILLDQAERRARAALAAAQAAAVPAAA